MKRIHACTSPFRLAQKIISPSRNLFLSSRKLFLRQANSQHTFKFFHRVWFCSCTRSATYKHSLFRFTENRHHLCQFIQILSAYLFYDILSVYFLIQIRLKASIQSKSRKGSVWKVSITFCCHFLVATESFSFCSSPFGSL